MNWPTNFSATNTDPSAVYAVDFGPSKEYSTGGMSIEWISPPIKIKVSTRSYNEELNYSGLIGGT